MNVQVLLGVPTGAHTELVIKVKAQVDQLERTSETNEVESI